MGKPSITNIRPPKTPPKTNWDLNLLADQDAFYASRHLADDKTPNTKYDDLVAQVNFSALAGTGMTPDEIKESVANYDYVFLGVNGGSDETVQGRDNAQGIIVTGDGKDHVTGGSQADLILTGNGMDDAHGGGGDDIIFGENGKDTLYGDEGNDWLFGGNGPDTLVGGTDDGEFSLGDGKVTLHDDIKIFDGTLGLDPDGDGKFKQGVYEDNKSDNLHKEGFLLDGDHVFQVFNFSPTDYPDIGELEDQTFSLVLYEPGFKNPVTVGSFIVAEDKSWNFVIDLTEHPDGGLLAVFHGTPSQPDLDDPQHEAAFTIAYSDLASVADVTSGDLNFVVGDTLTGGEGPDNFVYHDGDGVDEITDYNRDDGDVLTLDAVLQNDVDVIEQDGDSYVVFKDGQGGYVDNAAIKITGVTDFDVSEIQFA